MENEAFMNNLEFIISVFGDEIDVGHDIQRLCIAGDSDIDAETKRQCRMWLFRFRLSKYIPYLVANKRYDMAELIQEKLDTLPEWQVNTNDSTLAQTVINTIMRHQASRKERERFSQYVDTVYQCIVHNNPTDVLIKQKKLCA